MHEMGVVLNVVDTLKVVAEENHVDRVVKVTLSVGELTGCIPKYLQECWPAAIAGTRLEGAALQVNEVPGIVKCSSCNHMYNPLKSETFAPTCPLCKGDKWTLIQGRDFSIEDMEVTD